MSLSNYHAKFKIVFFNTFVNCKGRFRDRILRLRLKKIFRAWLKRLILCSLSPMNCFCFSSPQLCTSFRIVWNHNEDKHGNKRKIIVKTICNPFHNLFEI